MIRQDIRTYLLSKTSITDLVSTHVFLSRIPQGSEPLNNFPAIVFRRAVGGHSHDLDGSAGFAEAVFDLMAVAVSAVVVESICEAIRQALQGYRGLMGSTNVGRCTLDDEADDYIESQIGDDVGFHTTTLRYTIGYFETIPTF